MTNTQNAVDPLTALLRQAKLYAQNAIEAVADEHEGDTRQAVALLAITTEAITSLVEDM